MSNDPRDDAMREIEAALEVLIDRAAVGRGVADQRVKVRALIRSKLPQPTADAGGWGEDDDRFRQNEEHERAVEAWEKRAAMIRGEINKERHYVIRESDIDDALRLMRARPASGKDEAAGELLRSAKATIIKDADNADEGYSAGLHRAAEILDEAAERAGIKP